MRLSIITHHAYWLVFGLVVAGSPASGQSEPFAHEVVVRTSENFRTPDEVTRFAYLASQTGVTAISVLVKQDEDGPIPSGSVYYDSRLAPRVQGYESFDVLDALIRAAHPLGIRVRAWVPQFHDQAAVRSHPDWAMQAIDHGEIHPYQGAGGHTEYFVSPQLAVVQDYELAILVEIASHYDIDGLMLDWLRFDNFNMDFGVQTRQAFVQKYQVDPVSIDFAVDSPMRKIWNEYREEAIASYVHRVRMQIPAQLELGAFVLPPEFVEVAQNVARFGSDLNVVAPMCYSYDWGFSVDWIADSCLADTVRKAGKTLVSPTLDSHLSDADYHQILDAIHENFGANQTLTWFFHGAWTEENLRRVAEVSHW